MLYANNVIRTSLRVAVRRTLLLLLFMLLSVGSAVRGARSTGMAGPLQIPGSPLNILVADDASLQVQRASAFGNDLDLNGMVYPNISPYGDAGIFVRYGLDTIGPNFDAHDTTALAGRFEAWTPVSAPALSGTGGFNDPFLAHAAMEHSTGVTLTIDVQYVDGQDKFLLSWTVCPPAGGAGFITYLAADVQLTNTLPESSQAAFDAASGAISAYNPSSGWSEHLKPLTPAYAYMAANDIFTPTIPSRPLWDAIQAGQDLPNTIPPSDKPGDNSLALEWRQTLNDCRSMQVEWHVLLGPQIPNPFTSRSYLPLVRKQQ